MIKEAENREEYIEAAAESRPGEEAETENRPGEEAEAESGLGEETVKSASAAAKISRAELVHIEYCGPQTRGGIWESAKRYFLCFFLYCILGWIYEVTLALIYGWGFVNRGFLFGPYLPVYGVGALLLLLCLKRFMAKKRYLGKVPITPVLVFLLVILITTVLEYCTGAALWAMFQKRWWDYSQDFMNLNGYVCPRTSIRFGFGGLFFLYVCQPLFEKAYRAIPQKVRGPLVYGIAAVMLADFALTLSGFFM